MENKNRIIKSPHLKIIIGGTDLKKFFQKYIDKNKERKIYNQHPAMISVYKINIDLSEYYFNRLPEYFFTKYLVKNQIKSFDRIYKL